jgi:hypothetical protein
VSTLSETTMSELREALADQIERADGPTPELARLLRKVAAEAREKSLRPEELLVVFKQLWNSVGEPPRAKSVDQHERVRQTLVTLCIQAYYAE